jgi:hypothetical protein
MDNQAAIKELMKFVIPVTESGCWIWLGETQDDNGNTSIDGEDVCADRIFWEMQHGRIQNGLCIYHKCNVWCCVNPDHLFLKASKSC